MHVIKKVAAIYVVAVISIVVLVKWLTPHHSERFGARRISQVEMSDAA